jgi:hypothetical protein
LSQAFRNFAAAETGVDQKTRPPGADKHRVPGTAARQYAEFNDVPSAPCGKFLTQWIQVARATNQLKIGYTTAPKQNRIQMLLIASIGAKLTKR